MPEYPAPDRARGATSVRRAEPAFCRAHACTKSQDDCRKSSPATWFLIWAYQTEVETSADASRAGRLPGEHTHEPRETCHTARPCRTQSLNFRRGKNSQLPKQQGKGSQENYLDNHSRTG